MGKKRSPVTMVEYNEKDVLMGRGKRVSEWCVKGYDFRSSQQLHNSDARSVARPCMHRPGNIYFRQIINRHRGSYLEAARREKVVIAEMVIASIHKVGGRFLKEEGNDEWSQIDHARAVEKTCQALREKDKSNPGTANPFRDPNKRLKLQRSPGRKRRGSDSSDESDDEEDISDSEETESEVDDDSNDDRSTESEPDVDVDEAKVGYVSPIIQLKQASFKDMLQRLKKFQSVFGHTAVPPGFPGDLMLADWCTGQRHIRRAIESGYRKASRDETERLTTLTKMGFVWDYAEYHWNHMVQELKDSKNATAKARVVYWLQDLRRQVRTGGGRFTAEQTKTLKDLGITL